MSGSIRINQLTCDDATGVPARVHVQEQRHGWPQFLGRGEYIELDQVLEVRRRSERRLRRAVSASRSTESELELEGEGRVWYSRPVGGEYDDADVDSRGRVRWVSFGGRWMDEEASVGGESFVTAPEI